MNEKDILAPDLFPITCSNCSSLITISDCISTIENRGIVFADCGDFIFQGFSCPSCDYTILYKCPRDYPLISMINFTLQPSPDSHINFYEQSYFFPHTPRTEDFLHFY